MSYGFPEKVYDFDAIGHGKDYDSLHIFKLKGWDGKRFLHDLENKENWDLLPVELDAEKHPLCDVEFDVHMQRYVKRERRILDDFPRGEPFLCI